MEEYFKLNYVKVKKGPASNRKRKHYALMATKIRLSVSLAKSNAQMIMKRADCAKRARI